MERWTAHQHVVARGRQQQAARLGVDGVLQEKQPMLDDSGIIDGVLQQDSGGTRLLGVTRRLSSASGGMLDDSGTGAVMTLGC
jgi:hypothetical protein